MTTPAKRMDQQAARVVGSALLTAWNERHPIPREASSGGSLDIERAERLLKDLDGESLHALLMSVTQGSFASARKQLDDEMYRIEMDVQSMAERTDSLTLHRYVSSIKERREGLTIPEPKPLDPRPWEDDLGHRFKSQHTDPLTSFSPRDEFEQDQSKYPS